MKDLTTYISSALYYNFNLRSKVKSYFFKEDFKSMTTPLSIDIDTILKHYYKAQCIANTRYTILFLVFILIVLNSFSLIAFNFLSLTKLLFVAYIIVLFFELLVDKILQGIFKLNSSQNNINLSLKKQKKIESIKSNINDKVIYYGSFFPFVGLGAYLGGVSFSINLKLNKNGENVKDKDEIVNFTVEELYEDICEKICVLDIPNLELKEKLFINGDNIRNDKRYLDSSLSYPKETIIDDSVEESLLDLDDNEDCRYYKNIELSSRDGNLILNSLIRFKKSENTLFIRSENLILPPIKKDYKKIDKKRANYPFWFNYLILGIKSIFLTPILLLFSMVVMFLNFVNLLKKYMRIPSIIVLYDGNYNYGSIESLREFVSAESFEKYFQVIDMERYIKIIEQKFLNSLIDFLESKNIDTSDLKDKEKTILNNGIIITGGELKVKNLAVGKKAKSKLLNRKHSINTYHNRNSYGQNN